MLDLLELENIDRYNQGLDFESDHPLHSHFEEAEAVEEVPQIDVPLSAEEFMKDADTGIYEE